jgi:hypothetical protein
VLGPLQRAPLGLELTFEREVLEETELVELGESEVQQDDVLDALVIGTHRVLDERTHTPRDVVYGHEAVRTASLRKKYSATQRV